jgi:DNA (cytosine-5)-methyltransferase 1
MGVSMRFGSVCSGIEAATVAWHALGWRAAWLSEVDRFACDVLKARVPYAPNIGDMRDIPALVRAGTVEAPDVLCGGTPCQAFSLAGNRLGLDDDRGNLTLTFCEVADAIDDLRSVRGQHPAIIIWENVRGVLSSRDNAFGCFLGELAGSACELKPTGKRWPNAGYVSGPRRKVAWRLLDAQFFGVAQRRQRVWVVASARNDLNPAEILFEYASGEGRARPSKAAGPNSSGPHSESSRDDRVLETLSTKKDHDVAHIVSFAARSSDVTLAHDITACLDTHGHTNAVLFDPAQITSPTNRSNPQPGLSHTLHTGAPPVLTSPRARFLMPIECERLQGFPDDWTRIDSPRCSDSARHRAIGNSWPVPVARWIGQRIAEALR